MDKLIARAKKVAERANRRLKLQKEHENKRKANEARKEHVAFQKLIADDRRASRAQEKEDHRLGPLAPRRAVGKEELEMYGAFDQLRVIPPAVPENHRIKYWNIVEKDRVVVLKGPDRHKIGVVKMLDKENNTVLVEGMNMMPVKVPDAFKSLEPNQPNVIFREQPLHYNDVRLVVPLPDPETKQLRDTIVANIAMSKVFHDKREDEKRWTRYIKGTSISIPWPKKQEKEEFDQTADTRIMDVETVTYTPSLLRPPFPPTVIDELRNRYSYFRTRHDPEYVQKVEQMEAAKKALEGATIKTPVQLLNKKLREEKKARGKPVLTPEIMEQIGRVMAQNRPELLERVKQPQMDID
ncbi:hypothetical protein K440DRAFT_560043 [Wilcoxina mikolae CBS 423.85]|nr:hypothetical protein K440DRAFT_560043 [Wilcoxina mikolae CBS 423.85]